MKDNNFWFLRHNYSYIMIPKDLYKNDFYQKLSSDAKVMYGFFLDRTTLSYRNGKEWEDEEGNIFIVFPEKEIQKCLNCGHDKVTRIMKEMEKAGLIRRSFTGPGRAAHIVVYPVKPTPAAAERQMQASPKSRGDGIGKPEPNKPERNNPDINHPDYTKDRAEAEIKENISYEVLRESIPVHILNLMVSVMSDMICSSEPTETIGKKTWSRSELRSRLLNCSQMHIQFIYDQFRHSREDILYPRRYFLARLCEADDDAMDVYYEARVRHDMTAGTV